MNSYLKAKIQKIISKTSQSHLKKYLNYFKFHSDNSIAKEIIIMINKYLKFLKKKKNRRFTYLIVTPIGSEGQKYPDIKITINHEEDFDYRIVVFLLRTELDKLYLELIERHPVFRAINGTDTDVIQGGEFKRKAKYSVKVKFQDDEEELFEANSNSGINEEQEILTSSHQNPDKSQPMDSVKSQDDQFFMNSIHDESNLLYYTLINDNPSSSSHSSDLPQHLSNLNNININPDTNQLKKFTDSNLEKSEAYVGSRKEGLYEEHEKKHKESMLELESGSIIKEEENFGNPTTKDN
jgi:hypothetical protein